LIELLHELPDDVFKSENGHRKPTRTTTTGTGCGGEEVSFEDVDESADEAVACRDLVSGSR
jgi:hypothetical protein